MGERKERHFNVINCIPITNRQVSHPLVYKLYLLAESIITNKRIEWFVFDGPRTRIKKKHNEMRAKICYHEHAAKKNIEPIELSVSVYLMDERESVKQSALLLRTLYTLFHFFRKFISITFSEWIFVYFVGARRSPPPRFVRITAFFYVCIVFLTSFVKNTAILMISSLLTECLHF